jgi:crotonobetainyl-CoA:carnitine CoA-transferase CaiB-like acyl-CoA transferase
MTASSSAPARCSGAPNSRPIQSFLKNNDRVVHGKEIMAIFAGLFLKKPVAYWLDELEKAGVPSGPINNFEQVFADPHVSRAACGSRSITLSSRICR